MTASCDLAPEPIAAPADVGAVFATGPDSPRPSQSDSTTDGVPLIAGCYRLGTCFDARAGVERFHGLRVESAEVETPVVLVREPLPEPRTTRPHPPRWPSLAWDEDLARRAQSAGLVPIVDSFADGEFAYLVFEVPVGSSLWDAWDEPTVGAFERFDWLIQLAELLRTLHRVGAIVEALSPAQVWVTPLGQVVLDATVRLLPLPLPTKAPVQPRLTSSPELIRGEPVDARSDLYCFGAALYALELGHELSVMDFREAGEPKSYLERFPDAHPTLGRLLTKTLHSERSQRFPTGCVTEDLSGFEELIDTLGQAQRALGRVRLDLAAWTSTGMVRSGNEDTFALVHATEAYEGETEEYALVLVADGMGGSAAGEVAATLAVQSLRSHLMTDLPFHALVEEPGLPPVSVDQQTIRGCIESALKEANRRVYLEARLSEYRHGMGCTAEAVYVDGQQIVVGHVGDSRTYHLRRGRLVQVTRDQTVVGRMVEAGQLTPTEAETHPRRSELCQAIGGRADVEPEFFTAALAPGDWIVVCSDGLTGAVRPTVLQDILERATSAEQACRRLINRANSAGASDNVTVAVLRAT